MSNVRVVLVDDHAVVRDGLKLLIGAQPDLEVVGEASNGEEALEVLLRLRPDVAVIDISMPIMNGLELITRLKQADVPTRLLALTAHEDVSYVQQLQRMGAIGYLLKRSAADELIHAVRTVAEGRRYLDPMVMNEVVNVLSSSPQDNAAPHVALSERELEVMKFIARGFANKEIAAKLDISIKTVDTYKVRSMSKLGLHGRSEIVRYAISQGWLKAD